MEIQTGVQLHVIETKKFKDIAVCIRFLADLDEKQATIRSLLTLMMSDRSETYDTKQKMNRKLDQLYGASLNIQTIGYGASQVMDLRCKLIHPAYAPDADLLNKTFEFLSNLVFHPLLREDVFEESKAILKAKMKRMLDEPSQYAINQALKLGGKGTPLSISSLGDLDVLEHATLEDVKKAYEDLLNNNRVEIMICGDVNETEMMELCRNYFMFTPRSCTFQTCYKVAHDSEAQYQEEYRDISQSSIMMLWFTHTAVTDPDYYALRVANAIFGQYPSSYLFQEVREKNSLCYSVYSNLIAFDGALGVTTGVEKENIEKAITLIKQQFTRVCSGEFSDELIDISKTMIINSLLATKDAMLSLISLAYQNAVLNQNHSVDDIVEKVRCVTRDDIVNVISKCELKMTFVLTKEEEHA